MNSDKLIKKHLIRPGRGKTNASNGSKIIFHVKTETVEDNPKELDDSRKWKEPIELILGKKFKLEVWEACVSTMLPGELSSFAIDKKLVAPYPVVAKTLRDYNAKKAGEKTERPIHHCCGMGLKEGLGYADLDELMKNPKDLKFTIDLLKVEDSGSYEKEYWAMSEDEQRASIPTLREEGNGLYKEVNFKGASLKYSEAIGRLENLMLKEKPRDVEWNELNDMKLPLLLNYSQCQLQLGEYYSAIEHCSTVLEFDSDNVKALYRRGRAYINVFNPAEAHRDLERVMEIDKSLQNQCKKLLLELQESVKQKNSSDRETFSKLFSK